MTHKTPGEPRALTAREDEVCDFAAARPAWSAERGAPPAGPRAWADRWFAWRNRLLASPGFQRWAAAFPLTRWIARRRASALFDLCAGFVYSQILYAGVRTRLLEAVADRPMTLEELSKRLRLPSEGTRRLVEATSALRLTERRGQRFGLGVLGAAMAGNPAVFDMVEHHAMLYRDLADPLALLRGEGCATELRQFWAYDAAARQEEVAGYSRLMARSQSLIAQDILDAYPLDRHHRLLDVGGGEGAFVCACARSQPELDLVLFDLPQVVERARRRFGTEGLSARASAVAGDLFRDPLPRGADVASLVRVVHDHDDANATAILRKIRDALPRGGVLLLAEPMSDTRGAEAVGDAYFGFYLLAMGQGRPRRPAQLIRMLHRTGWREARLLPTRRPILMRLIVARS